MRIPKKIKIIGREIEVVYDSELSNREEQVGQAHYRYDRIVLQPDTKGKPRKSQQTTLAFLEEVLHHIFVLIRAERVGEDEKFMARFTEVLYQVLKDNKLYFGKENATKK